MTTLWAAFIIIILKLWKLSLKEIKQLTTQGHTSSKN